MNVGSILTRAAQAAPDRVALIYGSLKRSYREFNMRVNQLGHQLMQHGVQRGDRVAILQRNCPELLETLFATLKIGAIAVPLNARLHPREYAYILQDSAAKAIVFSDDFAEGLTSKRTEIPLLSLFICIGAELAYAHNYESFIAQGDSKKCDVECSSDEIAWLFYTSGTTGKPKGAMESHGNLMFMIERYPQEVYQLQPNDVVMHPGPLTHGSGLWALPITANAGTQLIPTGTSFDPDQIFNLIQTNRVTKIAFIAPTMITMLLNSPAINQYDLSSLRFLGYGGSPMYVEDLKRAVKQWGPILCQIYGQGETPMTITMLSPDDHRLVDAPELEKRYASAGRIRKDIEIAILDENDQVLGDEQIGEIALRGAVVMKGYWNLPEATAEVFKNNWYHTGDLGKRDRDGYYYLLDRKKEMIISGGANLYPRDVEEVLLTHPGVLEVAVIGVPDRLWGESVVAIVRKRDGIEVNESELLGLCKDNLAGYKKPRIIRFEDDLPKNGYGKILKRELKALTIAKMTKDLA